MLAFVPVVIESYRHLPPRLWPVMQVLVAHVGRGGRAWPGVLRMADITGVPRSSVSRYLMMLERADCFTRSRQRGGVWVYQIAARFLPGAIARTAEANAVPSRSRGAVPPRGPD